jgi:HEAT repeat protein
MHLQFLPRVLWCGLLIASCSISSHCAAQVEKLSDETALIAILAGDGPKADKALACKRLAVYGSEKAVPALAKLLADPELASWTRIALEAIPGTASDQALRSACESLQGNLLIGAINSLGVRRDLGSVKTLAAQLQNTSPEVVQAAAFALGKIGDAAATTALRAALVSASSDSVRSAVAEGCVLCAERLAAAGNAPMAIEIYDQVRVMKQLPAQRIVEATRGVILAKQKAGIPVLIEALRSSERTLFYVALQSAREMPSSELATALLEEVKSASPERAPLIVQTLADMPGTVDTSTIIQLAITPGSKEVRMAALGAIGRTGDATCVAPLMKMAAESEDLYAPVKAALVELPDEALNQEVVKRLASAAGDTETQLLVEVIGLRRISATAELLASLKSPKSSIRAAALESLGSTVPQEQLGVLIALAVTPTRAEDATAAQAALKTAAVRMPDREACATQLSEALKGAAVPVQKSLLDTLGAVGGTTALQTLATFAQHSNVELKDAASAQLGKWMTIDAAPVLLKLATTGPADKFQSRALGGYIRIARQFVMPEESRLEMIGKALEAAKQNQERKKDILKVMEIYPSLGTLKMALEVAQSSALKAEAKAAALNIADKLKDNPAATALIKDAGL